MSAIERHTIKAYDLLGASFIPAQHRLPEFAAPAAWNLSRLLRTIDRIGRARNDD
jgi:hypothetical protein